MQSFKAGDIVLCIDAEDSQGMLPDESHSANVLKQYERYTVTHDTADAFVTLEEIPNKEWMVSRFALDIPGSV